MYSGRNAHIFVRSRFKSTRKSMTCTQVSLSIDNHLVDKVSRSYAQRLTPPGLLAARVDESVAWLSGCRKTADVANGVHSRRRELGDDARRLHGMRQSRRQHRRRHRYSSGLPSIRFIVFNRGSAVPKIYDKIIQQFVNRKKLHVFIRVVRGSLFRDPTRPDPTHLLNTMYHKKGCQS